MPIVLDQNIIPIGIPQVRYMKKFRSSPKEKVELRGTIHRTFLMAFDLTVYI